MEIEPMTTPEPMRRDELLEMASLDALGMLEADEAAFFSRSFLEAPRMVQDEIRALQASIASDLQLVSDEEPPAFLRNKVIGAVLEEIDQASHGLAPIATIGALRNVRVTNSQTDHTFESTNSLNVEQHLQVERRAIRSRSMNRTLMAWRAATVGLAASLLATFMWVSVIANEALKVTQLAQSTETRNELGTYLGTTWTQFVSVPCTLRTLNPSTTGGNVSASIWINEKSGESFLVAYELQSNSDYTVRLKASNGTAITLGKVTGSGKVTGAKFAMADVTKLQFETIELIDNNGKIILATI
jgi:hypothetical protein